MVKNYLEIAILKFAFISQAEMPFDWGTWPAISKSS